MGLMRPLAVNFGSAVQALRIVLNVEWHVNHYYVCIL